MATMQYKRHKQAATIALAALRGELPLSALHGEAEDMFKNLTVGELERIVKEAEAPTEAYVS